MENDLDDAKKYLKMQVNPILKQIIVELIKNRPENPGKYIQQWLQENGPEIQRKLDARIKDRPEGLESTSETNSDCYDEKMESIESLNKKKIPKGRNSVSAEVYGQYNKKKDFIAPVHPKTEEQKTHILNLISKNFLFQFLDADTKKIITDAMEVKHFPKETKVIVQGENGDHLYLIDSGKLHCYSTDENQKITPLANYSQGDLFGELALLYNCPRAATIETISDSTLFSLDRITFNSLVKDAMIERRLKNLQIISKIELFDTLKESEKEKICDCIESRTYENDEYLIKEGDEGNELFFIKEGTCNAFKTNPNTNEQNFVKEYKINEYFGELSLLENVPRAASIIAVGQVKTFCINRPTFKRLFGPLEEILKRNKEKYKSLITIK